jgi:UDP-N-acetylglucosamine--dolichyl-phosphate N-acetylglucosaminephosphotransferase
MLGFLDDLFDIRWRHKLPIPIIAAVPTLLVYYAVGGITTVVLPSVVGQWLSVIGLGYDGSKVVDLGKLPLSSSTKAKLTLQVHSTTSTW